MLYKLADPGTVQLIRSSNTLITAIIVYFSVGTRITRRQWTAILLQICGLMVTQYDPRTGTSYPLSTYAALIFQTSISALAGVYNQRLYKAEGASLHAGNMTLYAAGILINFAVHLLMRILNSSEPGFFTGYNSWAASMVIMSNVLIGLAITAVYKCKENQTS